MHPWLAGRRSATRPDVSFREPLRWRIVPDSCSHTLRCGAGGGTNCTRGERIGDAEHAPAAALDRRKLRRPHRPGRFNAAGQHSRPLALAAHSPAGSVFKRPRVCGQPTATASFDRRCSSRAAARLYSRFRYSQTLTASWPRMLAAGMALLLVARASRAASVSGGRAAAWPRAGFSSVGPVRGARGDWSRRRWS
jgi:hypothetical protein